MNKSQRITKLIHESLREFRDTPDQASSNKGVVGGEPRETEPEDSVLDRVFKHKVLVMMELYSWTNKVLAFNQIMNSLQRSANKGEVIDEDFIEAVINDFYVRLEKDR